MRLFLFILVMLLAACQKKEQSFYYETVTYEDNEGHWTTVSKSSNYKPD